MDTKNIWQRALIIRSRTATSPSRMELLKDEDHRNDTLQKIFKIYPELATKENILYVPTFRKVNDELFMSALRSICQAADYDNYNLIIKVHPNTNLN